MMSSRAFQQKLSSVLRHWGDKQYDAALRDVDDMLKSWPGNSQLHVLWASLVQLQDEPSHTLDEAKQGFSSVNGREHCSA